MNEKEDKALNYIKKYMVDNGTTPTIREIGENIGLKSSSATYIYFKRLVKRGDIVQLTGKRYTVKGMRYSETEQ